MDDIDRYLYEDLGEKGDITSKSLFTQEKAQGAIVAKEACIVAGLEEAVLVFEKTGVHTTTLLVSDGDKVTTGTLVMQLVGSVTSILKGERLALNFICRMSGIATETHRLLTICKRINPRITIAATRKTTPGFRLYEKKAVVLGGGEPHRFGLYDMILIKDNHINCIGSVQEAIQRIQRKQKNRVIEIEVSNEEDALTAARLGVAVIMLDNIDAKTGGRIAKQVRAVNPQVLIEASGGITRRNIAAYARFADRISLGSLTHSVKSKDFSLEVSRLSRDRKIW